jgi:hypothetical protein
MRLRKLSILLGVAAISVGVLGALPAMGADHRDADLTKAAPRSDINDLYVFKGQSAGGYTAVITVNPLTSPADTGSLRLDPDTLYELKADTNGDAIADVGYKLTASSTGAARDRRGRCHQRARRRGHPPGQVQRRLRRHRHQRFERPKALRRPAR